MAIWYVLLALLPSVLTKGVAPTLSSQLKCHGESLVVSVACCGTGDQRPLLCTALDAPAKDVALVKAPTPILLSNVGEVSDGAAVLSASDVIMLEVRFADLIARSAHGLELLRPLLVRALRLRHIRWQKKLLVLAITDFESSDVSEDEVKVSRTDTMLPDVTDLHMPCSYPSSPTS